MISVHVLVSDNLSVYSCICAERARFLFMIDGTLVRFDRQSILRTRFARVKEKSFLTGVGAGATTAALVSEQRVQSIRIQQRATVWAASTNTAIANVSAAIASNHVFRFALLPCATTVHAKFASSQN